jgi:glycosyltransferase involved in cell wall biosynthesis
MKVAIVHYWIVSMRGGEKVLEVLCELFPEADIFTLVCNYDKISPTIKAHKITTSFLQKWNGVKNYQKMLPLMPMALESFDMSAYDLVISSEAGPAKGIITRPDSVHICYCHSPMRYIWDLYPQYYANAGKLTRFFMGLTSPWLRTWDVTTAQRVDHFIANSDYVGKRIKKFYRRDYNVIYPPVDGARFSISDSPGDVYICAGQITPYKKIEIAVEAFTKLGLKLVVLGAGATPKLKKMAGKTVKFIDKVDDKTMQTYFSTCRALVFPGVEDFGIVPLEVMASGRPVIAFGRGGVLETVIDGRTGYLFKDQSVPSLIAAVEKMQATHQDFDPQEIRAHALSFERQHFKEKLRAYFAPFVKALSPDA